MVPESWRSRWATACALALLYACGGGAGDDSGVRADAGSGRDASGVLGDGGKPGGSGTDGGAGDGTADASTGGGVTDASSGGGVTDANTGGGVTDGSVPAMPDATPGDTPPPGLSEPCEAGPGWTLFRFHYDPNFGQNPDIEVWNPTCNYSYAPQSACRIDGIGSVGTAAGGYAIALDGSDYLRVRFSVEGLSFSQAAVYLRGRSLSTTASTEFEVWSPLYGSVYGGPVDNDFVYDWYGVDWTGFLQPTDPPSLTAIQVYPHIGSGSLGVAEVELCVH